MTDRKFNPHGNRTANDVRIVPGLRVMDNNLDVGTVVGDEHDGDYGRETEHWFRIVLDHIPGAPDYSGNRSGGYRVMDGQRLSTVHRDANGRRLTVDARARELAGEVVHGFRSATSVVAYCGEVRRPDEDRSEATNPASLDGIPNLCPECAEVYRSLQ